MGNYWVVIKPLVELVSDEVIIPPPITKRTIELGSAHSPESVCVPFKYNLGNYIEALDKGANILIQAGGGCRLGFYGEPQEEILKSLGYEFDFIKLNNQSYSVGLIKQAKETDPDLTYLKIVKTFILTLKKLDALDKYENYLRKNIGFEKKKGSFENHFKLFLNALDKANTLKDAKRVKKKYLKELKDLPIDKPENPLRVGVVGELYILMEPFSNFEIEKTLGKKGVEIHRFVTISSILKANFFKKRTIKKYLKSAKPYLHYHIGAHGTKSVAMAHKLIKDGFDGIIHIKPFACMPEVNAMSALQKMSRDLEVPILYFSFDSQTSETGVQTRLEAFHDMLLMRREKIV